jgi:hypothetical protein
MHLSPSEFFILGRIMAAWQTASAMPIRPYWAASMMDTVNHVFQNFGLERVSPPGEWDEVESGDALSDVVWKRVEGHTPNPKPQGRLYGVIPGVPTLAMGVSPSVPGRLFVERTDGETCAWPIKRPKSGLYLVIIRWLQPWAAVSPHLWITMHEGSWPATVEEWRTLPDFIKIDPHIAFADDSAEGVAEAAETAAREAGCERAFRLGGLSGGVESRLWSIADRVALAEAFRRQRNDALGDPEENLHELLTEAVAVMESDVIQRVCRADDGAIGFYDSAREALSVGAGPWGGVTGISYAVGRAHGWTAQASSYLYGTFRSRGVA